MLQSADSTNCVFSEHTLLLLSLLLLPRHREVREVAIQASNEVHVRHGHEPGLVLWQVNEVAHSLGEYVFDLCNPYCFEALALWKVRLQFNELSEL